MSNNKPSWVKSGVGADINCKDFEGKMIVSLDCRAVNIIRFHFTDGSSAELESVPYGHGIYGIAQNHSATTLPDPE